jgi:LmbE family N-acetylglucosaminyl deacetylase
MPLAMLVFAHPDDETVALGARLGRFGDGWLVHVTDGAPRNEEDSRWHGFPSWREYRQARTVELTRMLETAGIPQIGRECLEVPDQEASHRLEWISRRVAEIISKHQPQVVFTHPYEGGHPDHDACAFAVHQAARLLEAQGAEPPLIIEGAFYNAGPTGMGSSLFVAASEGPLIVEFRLTPNEAARKQALIDCFVSQKETLHGFPREWERYRTAPDYDFRKPPHQPPVLYDGRPWGMTSSRFCELARQAEVLLDGNR